MSHFCSKQNDKIILSQFSYFKLQATSQLVLALGNGKDSFHESGQNMRQFITVNHQLF